MNDEDKKILVEWCGLEHFKWHNDNTYTYIPTNEKFNPDSDSNQLDMLEDKFMEEIDCHAMIYNVEEMRAEYDYWLEDEPLAYVGKGKTKNEARLNAIINYVKGLK